jgi:hypothetical protein
VVGALGMGGERQTEKENGGETVFGLCYNYQKYSVESLSGSVYSGKRLTNFYDWPKYAQSQTIKKKVKLSEDETYGLIEFICYNHTGYDIFYKHLMLNNMRKHVS